MVAVEKRQSEEDIEISEVWRCTGAQYDALVAAGAFDGQHVELLRGVIVQMSPADPPHAHAISVLNRNLVRALGERAWLRVQMALALGESSRPEPDLAVVLSSEATAHPSSALLAIEVADSSLRYDRKVKARLYAQAAIADYWIVNVIAGQIEVHREPTPEGYRVVTTYRRGERVAMLAFPDVTIAVDDVMPPR